MNTDRGKYVLRSTHQKVVEENKRLLRDIAVIVQEGIHPDAILLKLEYRKRFKEQRILTRLIKEAAQLYIKEYPELKLPQPPIK